MRFQHIGYPILLVVVLASPVRAAEGDETELTLRVATATRPLRTFEINGIQVGGLICNDMWANPQCTPMPDSHLCQQLSESGAQVIFLAINGGRNGGAWSEQVNWPYHESNMRMRAAAGKVWVVSADNCAPIDTPCSAPSGVLRPNGEWAAKAPRKGEHVTGYSPKVLMPHRANE